MAKVEQPEKLSFGQRLKQIGMVYRFTAKRDRWFVPLTLIVTLVPIGAAIGATVAGSGIFWIPIGLMTALLASMLVLNVRSRTAMLSEAEGQLGAAASVVKTIRGDWRIHAAITATTQQDIVHIVVGKPGVILLGEGDPSRVRHLISLERRRLLKVVGNADLRDYVIGQGEGQIPLKKLQMTLLKLPHSLSVKEIKAIDQRLTALAARPQMPKGAIPKNMRPPKMRGANRPR